MLNVSNPAVDQYLSFAGMVVPSNDFFMGNATPLQIFDSNGNFKGPMTINIYGSDIWDSDTEAQSITTGLTFIQGQTPGSGTQITNGAITPVLTEFGDGFLNSINGLTTAAGYDDYATSPRAANLLATIQISFRARAGVDRAAGHGACRDDRGNRAVRSRKNRQERMSDRFGR